MKKKMLLVTIAMMLMTAAAVAQPPQIDLSPDSKSSPVIVGDLKITLSDFFDWFGYTAILVKVENLSKAATRFDPQLLSFVQGDGLQIDLFADLGEGGSYHLTPQQILLNSGTHLQRKYVMSQSPHFPARLYYDGKFIADIVNAE